MKPVTVDLQLAPGRPAVREVPVSPGEVVVTLTHVGNAVGHMGLTVVDPGAPTVPIASDGMGCVEPGCSMRVSVRVVPPTRSLRVECDASVQMAARLELAPP